MLGQPGVDGFYGRGGEDVIVAVDGVKGDGVIQCGRKGHPSGLALIDPIDPPPLYCKSVEHGGPVAGLHKKVGRGEQQLRDHDDEEPLACSCAFVEQDLVLWPGAAPRYAIWQMYARRSGASFVPWSSMEDR
jgi:hypothetical protein